MKHFLPACIAICLLVSAGCGDKTKDKADGGGSGGGTKPSEWIVGKWDVTNEGTPGAASEIKMQWEFKSGGDVAMSMTFGDQPKTQSASWKVVSEDKMKLVMELTKKDEPESEQITATFKDADSVSLEAEGESEILSLTRSK